MGKVVIQISCDQVSIPWWRKLNNVTSFLDLSNIKFTSQVQEYNSTDDAMNIGQYLNSTPVQAILCPYASCTGCDQQQYNVFDPWLQKFTYIIRLSYLLHFFRWINVPYPRLWPCPCLNGQRKVAESLCSFCHSILLEGLHFLTNLLSYKGVPKTLLQVLFTHRISVST